MKYAVNHNNEVIPESELQEGVSQMLDSVDGPGGGIQYQVKDEKNDERNDDANL